MTIRKKEDLSCKKKPDIHYPCIWQYKVIGREPQRVEEAIREACAPHSSVITYSHSSAGGKYHSFNAEITVADETTRLTIYRALHQHPAIKIVL